MAEMKSLPNVTMLEIEELAVKAASVRTANIVLLGMAAPFLRILDPQQLRDAVESVFSAKGFAEGNLRAFDLGFNAVVEK